MKRKKVYVAGPYTQGDVVLNVRAAVLAANELLDAGFIPFVPHLTHLWHAICPRPYQDWLDLDLEWLEECDILLRLPGPSSGADDEAKRAKVLAMPVCRSVADVKLLRSTHP
jgi:hypothetical protein